MDFEDELKTTQRQTSTALKISNLEGTALLETVFGPV
jgi:hypothetical protein